MQSVDINPGVIRPYVRFIMEAREDRTATIKEGRYVPKNVAVAYLRPPGNNNLEIPHEVTQDKLSEWSRDPCKDHIPRAYEAWSAGQEVPVEGTAIKLCPIFNPAEVQRILAADIRTVEDLASIDEGGLQRIGMGARAMKQKAAAYMESADQGKSAQKIADLEAKLNDALDIIKDQSDAIEKLKQDKPKRGRKPKNESADDSTSGD